MFEFRPGFPAPKGITAEQVKNELDRIRQKYGILNSAIIVKESKHPSAILHNCFVWDDAEAARLYREKQAGTLVRAIMYVKKGGGEPELCSQYVLTYKDDQRQYTPMIEVRDDPQMFEYSLLRLRGILKSAEKSLKDLLGVDELPKAQRRKIEQVQRHVQKALKVGA